MKIPYGVADFYSLRTEGNLYVDRTDRIAVVEDLGKSLLFLRPELDHRYADLCLLRRPDARVSSLWDLLFEFKRLSLKELGMSGKDVKAASRAELMKLPKVKEVLDQAEGQSVIYRTALERSRGDTLKLRRFAVVALGFERLVVRPSQAGG